MSLPEAQRVTIATTAKEFMMTNFLIYEKGNGAAGWIGLLSRSERISKLTNECQ